MSTGRKGFTMVEIMIVIVIIGLLVTIAIPNAFRSRISANDAKAKATLVTLSTASESFAKSNSGKYPDDLNALTSATPPYLSQPYCGATASGYTFACTFAPGTYTFTATPVTVGASGTTTYTITTGGVLTP